MNYKELTKRLDSTSLDRCYPICVPSVLRPNWFTYQNVVQNLGSLQDRVFYFVREDQADQQSEQVSNIVVIPNKIIHAGFGADSTRAFIQKWAHSQGVERYFDIDDDAAFISMTYGAGENTRRLKKADRAKYAANIMALASEISDEVFNAHKKAVLGSFSRITPATCQKDYHKSKYIINGMGIPRAFMMVDIKRVYDNSSQRTGRYDVHCEDIGFCSNLLEHGCELFKLPSFLVDFPPHENNPRTEVQIQHREAKDLWHDAELLLKDDYIGPWLSYTMSHHVDKIKRPVGVNWHSYNRDHNQKTIVEEW